MLKSIQELFVDSFYLEDINTIRSTSNKKDLIDKRIH
jgi:hypothetical protein